MHLKLKNPIIALRSAVISRIFVHCALKSPIISRIFVHRALTSAVISRIFVHSALKNPITALKNAVVSRIFAQTEGRLQMLLSLRKNSLTSLFKEVRVFKDSMTPKESFKASN